MSDSVSTPVRRVTEITGTYGVVIVMNPGQSVHHGQTCLDGTSLDPMVSLQAATATRGGLGTGMIAQ